MTSEEQIASRHTMRTDVVQDGIWQRAKCLVHADCRAHGRMVQPSGRYVHLKSKTNDIKDLNANFVKHLEKRDQADGTCHADTWRMGVIHGPRAVFTVKYDCAAHMSGGEPYEEVALPDDTIIALAAARTAATAVANVLGCVRVRAVAELAHVHSHDGRCNKRKRSAEPSLHCGHEPEAGD